MSRMIQIRSVPDDVHRALKVRAAEEGVSLSELLLRMACQSLERPSRARLLDRIRQRSRFAPRESIADAIAAERAGR